MEEKEKKEWKENFLEKGKSIWKEVGLPKLCLIILSGVFLIVLSFSDLFGGDKKDSPLSTENANKQAEIQSDTDEELQEYTKELETRVKNILEKVEGIGKVEVMLTLKGSKEEVTLKDIPTSEENTTEADSTGGSRNSSSTKKEESSVLARNENGEEVPYVTKEIAPEVEGVVIIAQGAGSSKIEGEIIGAMEVLFHLPTHKIKVMKMDTATKGAE